MRIITIYRLEAIRICLPVLSQEYAKSELEGTILGVHPFYIWEGSEGFRWQRGDERVMKA